MEIQGDRSSVRKGSGVRLFHLLPLGKIQISVKEVRFLKFLVQHGYSCLVEGSQVGAFQKILALQGVHRVFLICNGGHPFTSIALRDDW